MPLRPPTREGLRRHLARHEAMFARGLKDPRPSLDDAPAFDDRGKPLHCEGCPSYALGLLQLAAEAAW